MKRALLIASLVLFLATAGIGKVTRNDAPRFVIITPDTLPINATEQAIAPYIDGWMVAVDWADSTSGQVATDATTCTVAPCTVTSNFATLNSYLTAANSFATLTCGAILHNSAGGPCLMNFNLRAASNQNPTYNLDTPLWVYSTAWQQTIGAANPQAAAFCPAYPNNTSSLTGGNLPPATGTITVNSTTCGAGGTTQCTPQAVAAGIPAVWQLPFLVARETWMLQFFNYLSSASFKAQIRYESLALSVGGENQLYCATLSGVAGTGLEALVSPATDAGLKTTFMAGLSSYWAAMNSYRAMAGLQSVTLVGRFNMQPGLTVATDPTWAVAEAQVPLSFQNVGVGSDGWKNYSGTDASDLLLLPGSVLNCVAGATPPCTSNNWSNVNPVVYGKVVYNVGQECTVSTPAGGVGACLDASAVPTGIHGTIAGQADTLWQELSLMGAAGINVYEAGPKEAQCWSNQSPGGSCGTDPTIQPAYFAAVKAWATGGIPINH